MEVNKGGRPKKEFEDKDFEQLEYLAKIQCTQKEMAGVLRVSVPTLNNAIKERYNVDSFFEWFDMYSADGKLSLRRAQHKNAIEHGNTQMQIWLGKQTLGQVDKAETTNINYDGLEVDFSDLGGEDESN